MSDKISAVKMKIENTGVSLGGFGGDGIHGTDQYRIVEIIGQHPLLTHKAGNHIDESDVRKFKEIGVKIAYS